MASAPSAAFHQPKHVQHEDKHQQHHHARLPVIPDLRFECSYLRSIRPYVEIERAGSGGDVVPGIGPTEAELMDAALLAEEYDKLCASLGVSGEEKEDSEGFEETQITLAGPSTSLEGAGAARPSEVIRVQWQKVLWVTMRDQVISPLLQGALWALASYYLTPYSAQLGSRMGTFMHNHIPTKEGLGVAWLRNWVHNLGLGSGSSNSNVQTSRTSRQL